MYTPLKTDFHGVAVDTKFLEMLFHLFPGEDNFIYHFVRWFYGSRIMGTDQYAAAIEYAEMQTGKPAPYVQPKVVNELTKEQATAIVNAVTSSVQDHLDLYTQP